MRRVLFLILCCVVIDGSLWAKGIATLGGLRGTVVVIEQNQKQHRAVLGESLKQKQSLLTKKRSKAQLIFNDNTIVTLGSNTLFSIEKYLYLKQKNPEAKFELLKGAMRVITGQIGKIAPQRFKVHTHTATIGIRGTNFTVIAQEDNTVRVLCTFGAVVVEVDNQKYEVNYGNFIIIPQRGAIEIKTLHVEDLKEVEKGYFSQHKSNAKQKSQIEAVSDPLRVEPLVVTTTPNIAQNIEDHVETTMQDGIQQYYSEPEEPEQIPEDSWVSMNGFSIDNDTYTSLDAASSLKIDTKTLESDAQASWVEVIDKMNGTTNLESDNWKIHKAQNPYVELSPLDGSSSKDAQVESASFKVVPNSDSAMDDYMMWGEWNADISYKVQEYGETVDAKHSFQGLWVLGKYTDVDVISAKEGSVNYEGEYMAMELNSGDYVIENGSAELVVDFGADIAKLAIFGNNVNVLGDYRFENMQIEQNHLIGGEISQGEGGANGAFYGPQGDLVGGNFQIMDEASQTNVKGVYQVNAIATPPEAPTGAFANVD
jgi:hypothetical protein